MDRSFILNADDAAKSRGDCYGIFYENSHSVTPKNGFALILLFNELPADGVPIAIGF